MLPTMILTGLAFTLVYGPLTIAATDGVADAERGLASGLFNSAVQLGAARRCGRPPSGRRRTLAPGAIGRAGSAS